MSHVGEQILLGVAWCREDDVCLFELDPAVFMFDVTMQTNCQQRPLGIGAKVDQNMNVFAPIRVFMLPQHSWVMEWIFGTCLPTLLGEESLSRTQLVLTDGDRQMHGAFDNNQADFCPKAQHGLCMHHLMNKGLERLKCKMRRQDKKRANGVLHTFKITCFAWFQTGGVESLEECHVSEKSSLDSSGGDSSCRG